MMEMMEFLRSHTSMNAMSDQEIVHFLASLEAAGAQIVMMDRPPHEVSPPALEGELIPDEDAA